MTDERPREYLHSWYLLVITFWSLLFLLINHHIVLNIILSIIVFVFYFKNGLKLAQFKKLFFYAFLFTFTFFLLNMLYPASSLKTEILYRSQYIIIYRGVLLAASLNMLKLFLISLLSMTSGLVIDYTKVVLHLIVHKGLKLFWGYPLLLAMNSVALFKKEFERIRLNARLRGLSGWDKVFIFFPLLVFAIRHSQRGDLSLVTRCLSQEKSFYFSYDLSSLDRFRLRFFFLIYLGLVSLAFFYDRLNL